MSSIIGTIFIGRIMSNITDTELKDAVFSLLSVIASSDGEYEQTEAEAIRDLAASWGYSEEQLLDITESTTQRMIAGDVNEIINHSLALIKAVNDENVNKATLMAANMIAEADNEFTEEEKLILNRIQSGLSS